MKILIIGKNSYIGNHIDKWMTKYGHKAVQLDVLNDSWKQFDYSSFDSIVHVAGIVHQPKCQDWELYKRVNADMPVAIAKMAKEQGVKQYVFFSTMGVYGVGKKLKPNIIKENTPLNASGMYSRSKLMAENGLMKLNDVDFTVACIRPPSVYGKGCKGGYISGFASIVRKLPIVPKAYNNVKQSFIYIDNLTELVRLIIENNLNGAFCPQDDKAINANELLKYLAYGIGKKYRDSRLLGYGIKILNFLSVVKKAYGGVEYAKGLSTIKGINYVVVPIKEGLKRTVTN